MVQHRTDTQCNGTESKWPHVSMANWFSNGCQDHSNQKEQSLQQPVNRKAMKCKNESGLRPHTIDKHYAKMNQRPKCRSWNYKTLRRKHIWHWCGTLAIAQDTIDATHLSWETRSTTPKGNRHTGLHWSPKAYVSKDGIKKAKGQPMGETTWKSCIWSGTCIQTIQRAFQSLSRVWLFAIPWTATHQDYLFITNSWTSLNSCPLSRWCHPTISSSVVPFSRLQSFLASGFFSNESAIGAAPSASVLPMNILGWFPLGLTGLISLQFKGLSRVSNTTVQKQQFFGAQLSL